MQLPELSSQQRLSMDHSIMHRTNAHLISRSLACGAIFFHVDESKTGNKQPCGIQ